MFVVILFDSVCVFMWILFAVSMEWSENAGVGEIYFELYGRFDE